MARSRFLGFGLALAPVNAAILATTEQSALETRHQVARAIAKSGFDQAIEAKLFEDQPQYALLFSWQHRF